MENTKPNIDYWNEQAQIFPRHQEGLQQIETLEGEILDELSRAGYKWKDKTILDVGSGTGMYAVKLAKEAKAVTALDPAERMLTACREDSRKLGLKNINFILSQWSDFQPKKKYDLVLCSLCPGIQNDQDREKLLEAGQSLVYIGFQEGHDPNPMKSLLKYYGVEKKTPAGGPEMRRFLSEKGLKFYFWPKQSQTTEYYDRTSAFKWCRSLLSLHGIKNPDDNVLECFLANLWRDDQRLYVMVWSKALEVIVWSQNN
ncbi:MAG: class I SAM-dependent methyltransferase [Deltaproteobacteria bacterium]|jgi:SAM-dependent methyltransferase|nr:class I SAM-dependent methyltransferase [Deltaproteobacteria bacterium]